jgi:hypothetical protein
MVENGDWQGRRFKTELVVNNGTLVSHGGGCIQHTGDVSLGS